MSDADAATARPATLHVYVPDVDAVFARAVEAGGVALYEPTDQPYGDREAGVEDPSGTHWFVATHTADVTPEPGEIWAD